jgi:hypothetical protein
MKPNFKNLLVHASMGVAIGAPWLLLLIEGWRWYASFGLSATVCLLYIAAVAERRQSAPFSIQRSPVEHVEPPVAPVAKLVEIEAKPLMYRPFAALAARAQPSTEVRDDSALDARDAADPSVSAGCPRCGSANLSPEGVHRCYPKCK